MLVPDFKNNELINLLRSGKYSDILKKVRHLVKPFDFEYALKCLTLFKLGHMLEVKEFLDYLDQDSVDRNHPSIELSIFAIIMLSEVLIEERNIFNEELNNQAKRRIQESEINSEWRNYLSSKIIFLTLTFLLNNGKIKDADKLLKEVKEDLTPVDVENNKYSTCKYHYLLAIYFQKTGNFDKAIVNFKIALDIISNHEDKYLFTLILIKIGVVYGSRKNFTLASDYFNEASEMVQYLDNEYLKSKIYNNFAIIHYHLGNNFDAIDYNRKSIEISRKLENYDSLKKSYSNLGNIFQIESKYDLALKSYHKAQNYDSQNKIDKTNASIANSLGRLHKKLGNFVQAEYFYLQSLEVNEAISNIIGKISDINNLGVIHNNQGNLSQALIEFEKVLELTDQVEDVLSKSIALTNMGLVYSKMGKYDQAINLMEKSLKIKEKVAHPADIAITQYHLINTYLRNNDEKGAIKVLKRLKKLAKRSKNQDIMKRAKLAEVLVLQFSDETSRQIKVQQLIDEVLSGEFINFEIKVFANISLCEYLILEYNEKQDPKILDTINETLQKLYDEAKENKSHELMAKTLILQSKFALVQMNTNQAVYLLKEAKNIAENYNLEEVKFRINFVEETVQSSLYEIMGQIMEKTKKEDKIKQMEHLEILDYVKNLYYQRETMNILKSDYSRIRKINNELANILEIENEDINITNLANIVEVSSRGISSTHDALKYLETNSIHFPKPDLMRVNVSIILKDVIFAFKSGLNRKRILYDFDKIENNFEAIIDYRLIELVFDHLIMNIIRYSVEGSNLEFEIKQNDTNLLIEFRNICKKIPEEVVPKLKDKYFGYYPSKFSKGLGIGLTFVDQVMMDMNKKFDYEVLNLDDEGISKFTVRLTL